ncbi:MAG TPA: hypothetical protein VNR37_02400 [Microbacteriaceae bacterium]|nr:hypothetical protein [Microbacteriaceae bacterium]
MTNAAEVARLRARIEQVERLGRVGRSGRIAAAAPVLPVAPGIARLLPDRGLRAGGAYALGRSGALLTTMLAAPSAAGIWCAVVGIPEFGVESALAAGVDLERIAFVPHPGDRWLGVVGALAESIGVVAVRPGTRVRDAEASRLAARLRERHAVLLVQGAWPLAEARLDIEDREWTGLGSGHGLLERCTAGVVVASRRSGALRRGRIVLAGAHDALGSSATQRRIETAERGSNSAQQRIETPDRAAAG